MNPDVVVIGAGIVGCSIAYGLAGQGVRVLALDGADRDFRAAGANFGLVWLQGKGMGMPEYQQLTRESVDEWADFSAELTGTTDVDLQYQNDGGLTICVGDAQFEQRRATLLRLHNQLGGDQADWHMIDRDELAKLLPTVPFGPEVSGASYGRRDGAANPLRLLAALQAGIIRKGGTIRGGQAVRSIRKEKGGGFAIEFGSEVISTSRVVIAAGLGSKDLAAQVGLDIPVRPQRGQILVTERMESFLPLPLHGIRQTQEGTVMIGATHEEAGYDASTTSEASVSLSTGAVRQIPALADATLVRQWAGLRIMTPDRHPIYAESETHPGAFVAVCHSGVTLAAVHSDRFAKAVATGRLPPAFDIFHQRRFDVPQAA